jgi:hypothetical protein
MKRGRRALLIFLGCVLTAVIAWLLWPREPQPRYHGKKLSYWLNRGYLAAPDHSPQAQEASFAVQQIGTNALPYLLRAVTFEGSVPAKCVIAIGDWVPFPPVRLFLHTLGKGTAKSVATRAQFGFRALGPVGKPMVPELGQRLHGTNANIRSASMQALAGIGKDGLPPLLAAFNDERYADRVAVIPWIVTAYRRGGEPELAARFWLSCLKDKNPGVVDSATLLPPLVGVGPEEALPALVEATRDPNEFTRYFAIGYLRTFGKRALSAIPAWSSCLTDPQERIRTAATNALLEIAPEVLMKRPAQRQTEGNESTK